MLQMFSMLRLRCVLPMLVFAIEVFLFEKSMSANPLKIRQTIPRDCTLYKMEKLLHYKMPKQVPFYRGGISKILEIHFLKSVERMFGHFVQVGGFHFINQSCYSRTATDRMCYKSSTLFPRQDFRRWW